MDCACRCILLLSFFGTVQATGEGTSSCEPQDSVGLGLLQTKVTHIKKALFDNSPVKCRHFSGSVDSDCCAGSDASGYPGYCVDGYVRQVIGSCGQGHWWCDRNGCEKYECVDPHTPSPTPGLLSAPGQWQRSYTAGQLDSNSNYAGGSEIIHLEPHNGKLFAANGYWMDTRNKDYGGASWDDGWGQVLRLDSAEASWEVDLELGVGSLRTELLKSVTFGTDAAGNPLEQAATFLIAGAFRVRHGSTGALEESVELWIRDGSSEDNMGAWEKIFLVDPQPKNESFASDQLWSTRDCSIHRDSVTGVDMLFVAVGMQGLFAGVYDIDAPGNIRFSTASETGHVGMRIMGIAEANGELFFSSGSDIYRRTDGQAPSWSIIYHHPEETLNYWVGGIRGLSQVPNPRAQQSQSLAYLHSDWKGCVFRVDFDQAPAGDVTQELCAKDLMDRYLGASAPDNVRFVLGNYNYMFPMLDHRSGQMVHLIGFEVLLGPMGDYTGTFVTTEQGPDGGKNFYAGAPFMIRVGPDDYEVGEVGGDLFAMLSRSGDALVAPRTFASSPFPGDNGVIYVGGFDCNWGSGIHNTAWVFQASTP